MEFYSDTTRYKIEKHCGLSIATGRHFHDLWEFYFLSRGEVTYFIDKKIYTLTDADVVVVPPATIHNTVTTTSKRERILFYLSPSYLSAFSDKLLLPQQKILYRTEGVPRIREIFELLLAEEAGDGNEAYKKALITELVVLLSRVNEEEKIAGNGGIVTDIVAYVNREYANGITLASTAKQFFMNPSYLSRIFKSTTGFNFNEYLNKYRIKEAALLLGSTSMSITEIAGKVGYNSTAYFCKMFKREMGVSALEVRSKNAKHNV